MALSDGIDLEPSFFGQKTVIIAKSGYGKSMTARVIVEEGRKLGVSFIIIDPQQAYLNLPGFSYVNAANIKHKKAYAQLIALTNKNVVISVKGMLPTEQAEFVHDFLVEYRRYQRKGIKTIIIDELHKFAPEQTTTAAKDVVRGMVQEDRSDGLGFIGVSQRVARVDKTIIAQANNIFIGKLDAVADLDAVKGWVSDKKELDTIRALPIGSFYSRGIADGQVLPIRMAETKHSGEAPKSLLVEDDATYQNLVPNFVARSKKTMADSDIVPNVIPSADTFMRLAGMGMKMALGGAAAGVVGAAASKINVNLPYISNRTVGAGVTMAGLYFAHSMIDQPIAKDVLKYAVAGSAAYTAGSLLWDVLNAFKVQVPNAVSFVVQSATGVAPIMVQGTPVDTNTALA